jgi:hypothetical protein
MNKTGILLILLLSISFAAFSQDEFSGEWYIGYQYQEQTNSSQFQLKRAYITYRKEITPWLKGRITPDITIDTEGNDSGDIELRMKYLFVQFDIPDFWIFTDNNIKTGVVPRPWIDYQQDIIHYRAQGQMFLERTKVINSTDYGISYSSNIGGNYENPNYQTACPGKYANISFGIFNGGGYNKLELNTNKTFEWRASFRPFVDFLPGLLLTYHGAYGTANSTRNNPFQYNGYHIGYEHNYFMLSAEYYKGIGNFSDSFYNLLDLSSIDHEGYSFFAELRHPKSGIALWARYDAQYKAYLEPQTTFTEHRLILSTAWKFYNDNRLIISRDFFEQGYENRPITVWEATLDIRF